MPARNTDLADINEIHTAYVLNGNKYPDSASKAQYEKKSQLLTEEQLAQQEGRAEAMAKDFKTWASRNGYGSSISKVYWTARPGFSFKSIVGYDVDQRKNPSDILVEFSGKKFLGLSAKSTSGKGDIGFKNPGVGTVEKDLRIKLSDVNKKAVDTFTKDFDLSPSANKRKQEIRSNPQLQKSADERGLKVLNEMRELMLRKLNTMNPKARKEYIITSWIDASADLLPPYVKVTGRGTKAPYSASVEDPLKNDKLQAINTQPIKFSAVGNDSIGVMAGNKKVLKMRFKYESQKLASSLKMSGDPW